MDARIVRHTWINFKCICIEYEHMMELIKENELQDKDQVEDKDNQSLASPSNSNSNSIPTSTSNPRSDSNSIAPKSTPNPSIPEYTSISKQYIESDILLTNRAAHIFQHEYDHLNGEVYIDKVYQLSDKKRIEKIMKKNKLYHHAI